ncbi:hypothetical protein K7G98_02470 [Saccharothrix sp. MB29]|nr:hypothetical protein [Saccharothrix sp. MB29]
MSGGANLFAVFDAEYTDLGERPTAGDHARAARAQLRHRQAGTPTQSGTGLYDKATAEAGGPSARTALHRVRAVRARRTTGSRPCRRRFRRHAVRVRTDIVRTGAPLDRAGDRQLRPSPGSTTCANATGSACNSHLRRRHGHLVRRGRVHVRHVDGTRTGLITGSSGVRIDGGSSAGAKVADVQRGAMLLTVRHTLRPGQVPGGGRR